MKDIKIVCNNCNGSGYGGTCEWCNGHGFVFLKSLSGKELEEVKVYVDKIYLDNETKNMINKLNERETKALNAAVSALWFADNSDYKYYLQEVIETLLCNEVNEKQIRRLYDALNPDEQSNPKTTL